VLNVRNRLSIGSCGQVYNSSNTAVINVPGSRLERARRRGGLRRGRRRLLLQRGLSAV